MPIRTLCPREFTHIRTSQNLGGRGPTRTQSVLVLAGTNGKIQCCCKPRRPHSFYGSYGFRFATAE